MHVYFSGIAGTGIGPLALIAQAAGFSISGSDKQDNAYLAYLKKHGITDIHVGQSYEAIAAVHAKKPIDWFVYTSALPIEQPDAPELRFCEEHHIKATKRDIFLNELLNEKQLKMIAIAGTHGKTTTTAMTIWLFKQLGIPISYSVAAKLPFGDMGVFNPESEYFIYEADEFDRNFLAFRPYLSIITGIDWDHPDIYPTREKYNHAFVQFLSQSEWKMLWKSDAERLGVEKDECLWIMDEHESEIDKMLTLPGRVNRLDAWQVIHAVREITDTPLEELALHMNKFPGVARRFEKIAAGIYSDYAHTPPKIRGALQIAEEVAGKNVIIIYEGLHNTRQHFIKEELRTLFDNVKRLYVVPSYLAREDPKLRTLTPADIVDLLSPASRAHAQAAALDDSLQKTVEAHIKQGDIVVCLSAGGGHSLDEWIRKVFTSD